MVTNTFLSSDIRQTADDERGFFYLYGADFTLSSDIRQTADDERGLFLLVWSWFYVKLNDYIDGYICSGAWE